jgi:ubiquinone biosynthesis protein
MVALARLQKEILSADPALIDLHSFDTLASLSQGDYHRSALAALFPDQLQKLLEGPAVSGERVDLWRIRAGVDPAEVIGLALHDELQQHIGGGTTRSDNFEGLCLAAQNLLDREVEALQQDDTSYLSDDQFHSTTCASTVGALIRPAVLEGKELGINEQRLLEALLKADNREQARGRCGLYQELMRTPAVSAAIKVRAFQEFQKTGKVSTFLKEYFEREIVAASEERQLQFFDHTSQLLGVSDSLPPDTTLCQILYHPEEAEEIIRSLAHSQSGVLWSRTKRDAYHETELGPSFRGSLEEFLLIRAERLAAGSYWEPDLHSQSDLVIYINNLSTRERESTIDTLRSLYLYGNLEFEGGRDHRRLTSIEEIEDALSRELGEFQFTDTQRQALQTVFQKSFAERCVRLIRNDQEDLVQQLVQDFAQSGLSKGDITFKQLTEEVIPEIRLNDTASGRLRELLYIDSLDYELIGALRAFGYPDLSSEQRRSLRSTLDRLENMYRNHDERVKDSESSPLPDVFEQLDEIIRFVLSNYVDQLEFGKQESLRSELGDDLAGLSSAALMRRSLEILGLEKVGQFLSSRPDLVPEEYCQEFEQFQESIEPGGIDEVCNTLSAELGRPYKEVFQSIDSEPIHVGTIGEVYGATLLDGTGVVVKVIPPSKRRSILTMLGRLETVADRLEKNKERLEIPFSPLEVFQEFRTTMLQVLDLRNEVGQIDTMRATLPPEIRIPRVFEDYSSRSLLVQMRAEGKHIRDTSPENQRKAVSTLGEWLLKGVLENGLYHEDLHPGNFRVLDDGTVEVLDFGRVGRLNTEEREAVPPFVRALQTGDSKRVLHVLRVLSESEGFNRNQFVHWQGLERDLKEALRGSTQSLSHRFSQVLQVSGQSGLKVPGSALQLLKGIMSFEGTANRYVDNFNLEGFVATKTLSQTLRGWLGG